MTGSSALLSQVRKALASESRIDTQHHHIDLRIENGALALEGELESVAAKKLALEAAAAAAPEVRGLIDRLRVKPAVRQEDGEILALVSDALVSEPAFANLALGRLRGGNREVLRAPDQKVGIIDVTVKDGVVTLDGEVPNLVCRRLAGLLAWWVPGSPDVVNGLGVEPDQNDDPDEIAEAVRLGLEKDPFVDASQIKVGVRGSIVRLTGLVRAEAERHMAEEDAWCIFGVDKVINEITTHP